MYDLRKIQTLFSKISNEKDRANIYPLLNDEVFPLLEAGNFTEATNRVNQAIATETQLDKPAGQIAILQDVCNMITKLA